MRTIRYAVAILCLFFAGVASASEGLEQVQGSSGTVQGSTETVSWPDYKSDPWVPLKPQLFIAEAANRDLGNRYIQKMEVIIGWCQAYVIFKDDQAAQVVIECFIFNYGVTMKSYVVFDDLGQPVKRTVQIFNGEEWLDIQPPIRVYILDTDKFFKKGVLIGILISFAPADGGPPKEFRLYNPIKKK